MTYEKKIEPIRRWEVLATGITLQLWFFFFISGIFIDIDTDCLDALHKSDISSMDDMDFFHECIKDHRPEFLANGACFLLGFPILVAHVYFYHRITETIDSFLHFGVSNWLYISSWAIWIAIGCTMSPALGIFIAYYEWEFAPGFEYAGYAVQYQFCQFWWILYDCLVIPLGFACAMPWLRAFLMMFNFFESTHYKVSRQGKEEMLSQMVCIKCIGKKTVCCDKCGQCGQCFYVSFLGLFVMAIIFGSIADALDFDKDGFWSYKGGSQFLQCIIYIAIEFQSIWYFRFYCKFESNIKFLKENVRPKLSDQDDIGVQMA